MLIKTLNSRLKQIPILTDQLIATIEQEESWTDTERSIALEIVRNLKLKEKFPLDFREMDLKKTVRETDIVALQYLSVAINYSEYCQHLWNYTSDDIKVLNDLLDGICNKINSISPVLKFTLRIADKRQTNTVLFIDWDFEA